MKSALVKKLICGLVVLSMTAGVVAFAATKDAKAADATMLNTYGCYFGKVGTCLSSRSFEDTSTINYVKKEYNSITLENEMKPDALLNSGGGWWGGGDPTLISREQAERNGYYIPADYKDNQFPQINFDTVDAALKMCYENGFGMRGHTLVWHSQTPNWFFRENYNGNSSFVSEEVMTARMEFYIKSVMYHVYNSPYGSCVYAWDVVNEHFHATQGSGWISVYKKAANDPDYTQAEYIKKAFEFAYQALEEFNYQYSVGLFYNDYSTYDVKDQIVELIKYVNKDKRICTGVGMQSHIKTTYPTVEKYIDTLSAFAELGEVQITEMDIGNNGEADQAAYVNQLFTEILNLTKNGAKVTALVFWGLNDNNSWRRGENALLHSGNQTPKQSYTKLLDAYTETIGPPSDEPPAPVRVEPKYAPPGEEDDQNTPDNGGDNNGSDATKPGDEVKPTATPDNSNPTASAKPADTDKKDSLSIKAPKKVKAVRKKASVKITWKKVKGAYKYEVYRSNKKKGKYKKIKTVKSKKYTDKTAKKGKKYYYKIKTVKKIDGSLFTSLASKAAKAK